MRKMAFLLVLAFIFTTGCNDGLKSGTAIKTNESKPTLLNESKPTITNEPEPTITQTTGNYEPEPTITQTTEQKIRLKPEEDMPGMSKNYLILLETSAHTDAILEFKEYKEARGYNITVKSVDKDILMENSKDKSDAIHQFLKAMDKELLLDYVLFIGEPYDKESACPQNTGGVIPMKYMYYIDDNHNTRYHYDWYNYEDPSKNAFNTPTDIYYAFDCDWDYDKDGFAGEFQEIKRYKEEIGEPSLMFCLGRIPFSEPDIIKFVLGKTMEYEENRKEHSNALIASGIIGYPEREEFPDMADGAYYADILSKNLTGNGIETATLFEKDGVMPSPLECTYPLNYENFQQELNKNYDFTYIFGHGGYSMVLWKEDTNHNRICDERETFYDLFIYPPKRQLTGFFFMDGCHTMRVESDTDSTEILHIQDFLRNEMNCAALATTRDSGFSPRNPEPSISSVMFSTQTLIISEGFYKAAAKLIFQHGILAGTYIYCYLGDPSIRLKE